MSGKTIPLIEVADRFEVPIHRRPWKVYPTDISQFVKLDQCQRFLRLRLHEQSCGLDEFRATGATPQELPPMLAVSGERFETGIGQRIADAYPGTLDWGASDESAPPAPHNHALAELARSLAQGTVRMVLQPALRGMLGDWALSGRADIVRLERDADGALSLLVADIKASPRASVEHRLQVAFYHELLEGILSDENVPVASIRTAVLFRGERLGEDVEPDDVALARREAAARWFAAPEAFLEIVDDPESFRSTVRDLLTGPRSLAKRVVDAHFDALPFHLGRQCDKCMYNDFCMRQADASDDLSLLPFLSAQDKRALQSCGIDTVSDVAALKVPGVAADGSRDLFHLRPAPGMEDRVATVAATWPVGPRIDELVYRAWRYRRSRGDDYPLLAAIPSKGYGSLPYCAPDHNPNLVRIFIEAQHDFLQDRLYLLSALVTAARDGENTPERRRFVVEWTDEPPSQADEASLLVRWIGGVIRAAVELTDPESDGCRRAPIHLIFSSQLDQQKLLEALSRHASEVVGATALFDLMTQRAGFDSPVLSCLDREVRDLKNVATVCQPLHVVAERFRFRWNEGPIPFRDVFRYRLFDYWVHDEEAGDDRRFYVGRARFGGQVPLEYAYAAWDELPAPPDKGRDAFKAVRGVTLDQLIAFAHRRLEAMEHVAGEFRGNRDTVKTAFDLPNLHEYVDRARDLAEALEEFVAIERHVYLAGWKQARHAAPERRALAGVSLPVTYREADQDPEAAARNRENLPKAAKQREAEEAFWRDNPGADRYTADPDVKKAQAWSHDGLHVRLEVIADGVDADAATIAAVCPYKPGDSVIVARRWHDDLRVPAAERTPRTPTAKQLLYGMRARVLEPGLAQGEDGRWTIPLEMTGSRGSKYTTPWVFGSMGVFPFREDEPCLLEEDPNSWMDFWANKVVVGLRAGNAHALFDRLRARDGNPLPRLPRPAAARDGQRRFLDGLRAFAARGLANTFETVKEDYIGGYADESILVVQGPPGTGKSFTTGHATLARAQGALAAGEPFRALLCCTTHAATDVLVGSVLDARESLRTMRDADPDLFAEYFDPRLLNFGLYRIDPRGELPTGIRALHNVDGARKGDRVLDAFAADGLCAAAATPGGVYKTVNAAKRLFGADLATCLVLDEASQMDLPKSLMAALPLAPDGQVIVVGDHRQMPPIVQHDWDREQRRTFADYAVYRSLFDTLEKGRDVPVVRFAESFRLHRDIAAFLRKEIYRKDGIDFRSHRDWTLDPIDSSDAFVNAVLDPRYPLTVVVHDEENSQQRNAFERVLIAPVAQALLHSGMDLAEGFGIVVPHRAQRAELQQALVALAGDDPEDQERARSAVDTVERFQGGERRVIVISATESDPGYLLAAGKFLYDPRRLTVALSRAKQKMVLVASRSVFSMFSPDDETFENTLLWRNLLERACTVPLFDDEIAETRVQVWGNPPLAGT